MALHSLFMQVMVEAGIVGLLLLFAWLAISNHCALGSIAKNKESAQMHARCCGGSAPQGGTAPGPDLRECCKTLHALPTSVPANIAKLVATALTVLPVWTWVDEVLAAEPARSLEWMDSGPPRDRGPDDGAVV